MSWCFGVINGMASIWGGNYEFLFLNYEFHVGVYCLFEATVIVVRCAFFQNKMIAMILTGISKLARIFCQYTVLACLVRGKSMSRSNTSHLHKLSKTVVCIASRYLGNIASCVFFSAFRFHNRDLKTFLRACMSLFLFDPTGKDVI